VHEIIDQALRFADGFQLDDAHAALEEIARVGPGGNFLSQPSTLKNYKNGYYVSRVYPRHTMEKWRDAGEPSATQVLREKTLALLESAPAPADHDVLMAKGEEFIRQRVK
jgi:trimethylamine--corrinoid protein Co-methyltransferase